MYQRLCRQDGKDYIYGTDIEDFKHALHVACFENDLSELSKIGIRLQKSTETNIYGRYLDYSRQIGNFKHNALENFTRLQALEHLQSLQSLQSLQRLQSLQSLQRLQSLQSLQSYGTDYKNICIPKDALIYCDIPYVGTNCGKYGGFNHADFYEWARRQDNIFISEYTMPDDFIEIANTKKVVLSSAIGNGDKAVERIFTNRRTYDRLPDDTKQVIAINTAEQITLF